jgi:hypothetical protein
LSTLAGEVHFGAKPFIGIPIRCEESDNDLVRYKNSVEKYQILISFDTLVHYLKVACLRHLMHFPADRDRLEAAFNEIGKTLESDV